MSKKQIHSRLENLFIDLAENGSTPTRQEPAGIEPSPAAGEPLPGLTAEFPADSLAEAPGLAGWIWEIDASHQYVYCGPEVSDALRMNPQSFPGKDILSYGLRRGSKAALESALRGEIFPVELTVQFDTPESKGVTVQLHVLARLEKDGQITGWRGFAQRPAPSLETVSPKDSDIPASPAASRKRPATTAPRPAPPGSGAQRGYALENGGDLRPAAGIWTDVGKKAWRTRPWSKPTHLPASQLPWLCHSRCRALATCCWKS